MKKGFTLTELLVVVIIIGVLSVVVLPKFNKVIETRKTTEAEELMATVRTEQEKRCAFDKNYLTDYASLAAVLPAKETKNFTYDFTSTGMLATSKGKYGYQLRMPSYADGRICCALEPKSNTKCWKTCYASNSASPTYTLTKGTSHLTVGSIGIINQFCNVKLITQGLGTVACGEEGECCIYEGDESYLPSMGTVTGTKYTCTADSLSKGETYYCRSYAPSCSTSCAGYTTGGLFPINPCLQIK